MTIFAILLTVVTAVLLAAERGSDFAPMRGLLFLAQSGAVIVREIIVTGLILRSTQGSWRWLAAAYLLAALAAWLNLAAAGQRHPQMPEFWAALAPIVAFAIPILALAAVHWRHAALFVTLGIIVCLGLVGGGYVVAHLQRDDSVVSDSPQSAIPEAELLSLLHSTETQSNIAALKAISSQKVTGTPQLVSSANAAMERMADRITDRTATAWLFHAYWAAEYLGKEVCPGLKKLIFAAERFPSAEDVVSNAKRYCEQP